MAAEELTPHPVHALRLAQIRPASAFRIVHHKIAKPRADIGLTGKLLGVPGKITYLGIIFAEIA